MRTFKLILYFLLVSNGYQNLNSVAAEHSDEKGQEGTTLQEVCQLSSDINGLSSSTIDGRQANQKNPIKLLGFGSFNNIDALFDAILVKNDIGKVAIENKIPLISNSYLRHVLHSKSKPDQEETALA